MVMKIYVKKIEGLTLPKKASEVSAGYDIIATSDPKIVGESEGTLWKRIDYIEYETNLFIAPEAMTFHTLIHPRSSVSKYNLVLSNSIGLIDNDYRGMVICRFKYIWQPEDLKYPFSTGILGNVNYNKIYKKGDTIAQLVFEPTVLVDFELVDDLTKTKRGEGGFGSTDKTKTQPKQEVSRIISGKSLADMYNEAGGVPVKERYSEQIKKREVGV
jgi:dUTP pyrophosphatase